jgi:hypothetical protein
MVLPSLHPFHQLLQSVGQAGLWIVFPFVSEDIIDLLMMANELVDGCYEWLNRFRMVPLFYATLNLQRQ